MSNQQKIDPISQSISILKSKLEQLNLSLEEIQREIQLWLDVNEELSQSALEARANTQSLGRGLGGMILGSKYRASARRHAATINAGIAREVAEKRRAIKEGKKESQEQAKELKAQISAIKAEIKELEKQKRDMASGDQSKKKTGQNLNLLQKLKEAYDLGLLTVDEYEEKRKKIANEI
jgi:outer membrane murein-binding lipoprotein Lpp